MPMISRREDWEQSLAATRATLDSDITGGRQRLKDALVTAADALVLHIDQNVGQLGTDRQFLAGRMRDDVRALDTSSPSFAIHAQHLRGDLERLADETGAPVSIIEADTPTPSSPRNTNRDAARRGFSNGDAPTGGRPLGEAIIGKLLDEEAPRSAYHRRKNNMMLATVAGTLVGAEPVAAVLSAIASPGLLAASAQSRQIVSNQVTVTPTGGRPPYRYGWIAEPNSSGLIETPDSRTTRFFLDDVAAGETVASTFTCVVTDASGDTVPVTVPVSFTNLSTAAEPLTATAAPAAVTGDDPDVDFETDETTVTVTGGVPPYTFRWTSPDDTAHATDAEGQSTTFLIEDLDEGEMVSVAFTCRVTDDDGISDDVTVTATFSNEGGAPEPLIATAEPPRVESNAANPSETSATKITVTGGVPPYEFLWSTDDESLAHATRPDSAETTFVIDDLEADESAEVHFTCAVTDDTDDPSFDVGVIAIFRGGGGEGVGTDTEHEVPTGSGLNLVLPALFSRHRNVDVLPDDWQRLVDGLAQADVTTGADLVRAAEEGRRRTPFKSLGQVVVDLAEDGLRHRGDDHPDPLPDPAQVGELVKELRRPA
jgi:hypothetical protein